MCGICGFIDFKNKSNEKILSDMVLSLKHRGPNDEGIKIVNNNEVIIGLGHARLSILDLSYAGHQPMIFENLSIVFNGEIYNYKIIKNELEKNGHIFKSESDTEVILHSFKEWGNMCVEKFIGMFVFAIFDEKKNILTIYRDRAGVKPLYTYWDGDLFIFSSELKSFHKHLAFKKVINKSAVSRYFDFGYVPSPYCIFENCEKLSAGYSLTFNINKKEIFKDQYWCVKDYYLRPKLDISYEDAKVELEELLLSAFQFRMVSDVPVGVFLSGGIDSSILTALLQENMQEKLKTFTIGFDDERNEAQYAKEISKFLGTEHTELYCSEKEALEIVPTLPYYFDEPFADHSAIPTILVSQLAKKKVTVALSADAGDEIFAGYNSYKYLLNDINKINSVPFPLRSGISHAVELLSKSLPNHSYRKYKLEVLTKVLRANQNDMPHVLWNNYPFSIQSENFKKELFLNYPFKLLKTPYEDDFSQFQDPLTMALIIDYQMFLQNDILTKVDRATMSVSIEGREPFLDHRIIEFAAQLPNSYKFDGQIQKKILNDITYKHIPKELLDRPKAGFGAPIESWLKGDLNYLVEEFLNEESINKSGIFSFSYIKIILNEFNRGSLRDTRILWRLLQFQMWFKYWM